VAAGALEAGGGAVAAGGWFAAPDCGSLAGEQPATSADASPTRSIDLVMFNLTFLQAHGMSWPQEITRRTLSPYRPKTAPGSDISPMTA
jgi:hypothetical protein